MSKVTHGLSKTGLYHVWQNMKARCNNPNNPAFKDYGGRGIRVCSEWVDFPKFAQWALVNGYLDTLAIDRINGNLNYSPSNCRWATSTEQNNNRRNNRRIEFNGKTLTVAQWAIEIGVKKTTLHARLNDCGWTVEKALTTRVGY